MFPGKPCFFHMHSSLEVDDMQYVFSKTETHTFYFLFVVTAIVVVCLGAW